MLKTVDDYKNKYPWFFEREQGMRDRLNVYRKRLRNTPRWDFIRRQKIAVDIYNCEQMLGRVVDVEIAVHNGSLIIYAQAGVSMGYHIFKPAVKHIKKGQVSYRKLMSCGCYLTYKQAIKAAA